MRLMVHLEVFDREGKLFNQALHKKSKQSAKGAKYESQGQVPSNARHVAPGCDMQEQIRPERPKYHRYYALSALDQIVCLLPGATRSAPLRACPWLSYSAPLALRFHFLCKALQPGIANMQRRNRQALTQRFQRGCAFSSFGFFLCRQ